MFDASPSLLPADQLAASPPAIDAGNPLAVAKAQANLSRRERAVLRELTLVAGPDGLAQIGQVEIARATRLSLRTIRMACKELEAGGWIARERISAGKTGRVPDRYTVHPAPRPTTTPAA